MALELSLPQALRLADRLLREGDLGRAARLALQVAQAAAQRLDLLLSACRLLRMADRAALAVPFLCRAFVLSGRDGRVAVNLGNALRAAGRSAQARVACRLACALAPDLADGRFAYSLTLLTAGRYAEGFAAYEARPDRQKFLAQARALGLAVWDGGGGLEGRSMLVVAEQGLGDTIQFARFLTALSRRGARVHLRCPVPLRRLLDRVEGICGTVGRQAPAFDLIDSLGSLAHHLGQGPAGGGRPYLRVAPGRRLAGLPRPRVGVAWAGNPRNPRDPVRRCPFEVFSQLFSLPGITWVSLQRDQPDDRLAAWPAVIDLGPELADLDDTAAVLGELDLVISIDSAVAHLAGALGVPCWLLLGVDCDWRWGPAGTATAWYASLRLWRQERAGDWAGLIGQVKGALGKSGPGGSTTGSSLPAM
ncbi:MAG: hypothetical protein OHK0024_29750 [Thalassobaculales bacterium]